MGASSTLSFTTGANTLLTGGTQTGAFVNSVPMTNGVSRPNVPDNASLTFTFTNQIELQSMLASGIRMGTADHGGPHFLLRSLWYDFLADHFLSHGEVAEWSKAAVC